MDGAINRQVVTNVSVAADIAGNAAGVKPLDIRGRKTGSFHIEWPSGSQGTWAFLISNRPDAVVGGVADPTKFQALPNPPSNWSGLQPSGSNTGNVFTFADLAALWILPKFTRTAGTGNANAWAVFF